MKKMLLMSLLLSASVVGSMTACQSGSQTETTTASEEKETSEETELEETDPETEEEETDPETEEEETEEESSEEEKMTVSSVEESTTEGEALSEEFVTDAYYVEDRFSRTDYGLDYGGYQLYTYRMPKLREDSEDAKVINVEIEKNYKHLIEAQLEDIENFILPSYVGVDYYTYEYEDVTQILMELVGTEALEGYRPYHGRYVEAFYYDHETGKKLSTEEFLEKFEIPVDMFLADATFSYKINFEFYMDLNMDELRAEYESIDEKISLETVFPYVDKYGTMNAAFAFDHGIGVVSLSDPQPGGEF